MKKFILMLFVMMSVMGYSQSRQSVLVVPDTTTNFKVPLSNGSIVSITQTSSIYIIKNSFSSSETMHDVFASGDYEQVGSGYTRTKVITVGALGEQYSDFNTAVVAAGAGDVIELSASDFNVGVASVTMPKNSTLKVYEGGMLTGTFNLVGDSTRLVAGLTQIFDDNVTLSGTWIVDKTFPEWFGMDGGVDESTEFQKVINFCELTTGKNIILQNKHYYFEGSDHNIDYSLILEGNNATLHFSVPTTQALDFHGTAGTYYDLDEDAPKGSYWITLPTGSALLNLTSGTVVNITSNSQPYDVYDIGETKIVDKLIGEKLFFTEPLFWTYLVADSAKVATFNSITPKVYNLNLICAGVDNSVGLKFQLCKSPIAENVSIFNADYAAFVLIDSYAPIIKNCRSESNDEEGLGYGIGIYGATTNSLVDGCVLTANRHAVAHGGNSLGHGYPVNSVITNTIGTSVKSGIFDAHPGTYSVTWENCKGYAGMVGYDTTYYKGAWSDATTYADDEIVLYNNSLYRSSQGTNLNHQPDLVASIAYWREYQGNYYSFSGFLIRSSNVTIKNCEIHNATFGVNSTTDSVENIVVDGLLLHNCLRGIQLQATPVSNSYFTNIQMLNKTAGESYLVYLAETTLNNVDFGTFSTNNGNGFVVDSLNNYNLYIENLKCKNGTSLYVIDQVATLNIHINSLISEGNGAYSTGNLRIAAPLGSLTIDNWNAINITNSLAYITNNIDYLHIGNISMDNDATLNSVLRITDTVTNLVVKGAYASGSGSYELLEITGAGNVTNASIGHYGGEITSLASSAVPTNLYSGGNLTDQNLITKGSFTLGTYIYQGADRFFHNFKPAANNGLNTFGGIKAGNFTMTSATASEASYNTGFGYESLTGLTTGFQNTGIGYGALKAANTGSASTALGYLSLSANTTGTSNVAVGDRALAANTTGASNTAVGSRALVASVAASNTAVGALSMATKTSGGYNSTLGDRTLYSNVSGTNNTAIGYQSGYLSTGNSNVFLGYRAGYNELGNYKILISQDSTSAPFGMRSDSKALMYGDQSNANKANHTMSIFAKLGIYSATAPTHALEVTGDGYFSSGVIYNASDTTTAILGKVVFMAADSSWYGCRSTVATQKWYKINP